MQNALAGVAFRLGQWAQCQVVSRNGDQGRIFSAERVSHRSTLSGVQPGIVANCGSGCAPCLILLTPLPSLFAHVTHLLVVDDHRSIRDPLAAYLRRQGFEVSTAADGIEARAHLSARQFDLVVLDRMLPGEDGLALCRHIGSEYGTPVILLTALVEHSDRISGLDQGADDYVTKPFNVDELVARIRSVLRRASASGPRVAAVSGETGFLHFSGWSLDLLKRTLLDPHGVPVSLSSMEYRLLRAFLNRPNQVLSRDELLEVSRQNNLNFDRSIDSQISRLRRKLEEDPRHPALLKTIWGDGYLLAADVHRQAAT